MTPEELAAYREWLRIMEFKDNAWPCMALTHIDQQATLIKELDDAVSGPLENIAKMLETVNADTIFSGIIQTWKNENQTLQSQVAALKKIAEDERAYILSANVMESTGVDEFLRTEARRQLAEEHPEAFR